MKKRVMSAVMAAALTAGVCVPARAVGAVQAAGGMSGMAAMLLAGQAACEAAGVPSAPPEQTAHTIGLVGLERTVREKNPTLKSLKKMVASLNSMSAPTQDAGQIQNAIDGYRALMNSLENACEGLDQNDPLYITYQAQIRVLKDNIASLEGTLVGLPIIGQATKDAYEEAAYSLEKQAENVEKQLCAGAESMLIGLVSLASTQETMERKLDNLDRNLTVMKIQLDRGMISSLTYENMKTTRDQLAAQIGTLRVQRESMSGSLALMCGYGADAAVEPSALPEVSARELSSMNYEADLKKGMELSYTRWQKADAVREAANKKDDNVSGTEQTYEAAKKELAAAEESLTASFRQSYDAVTDAQTKLKATEFAAQKAQADLEVSRVKYEIGTISQLAYQQAQDDAADAKDSVASAEISLLSAYRTYQWACKGLIQTGE